MPYSLLSTSVTAACKKHWPVHRTECNQFVQAVAAELLVLIPGNTSDADLMVRLSKEWVSSPGSKFLIPRGRGAATHAIGLANAGSFVIAGMTADDINLAHKMDWHPPMVLPKVEMRGHVAVVTPGIGTNGWPRGYWGKHGGAGEHDKSLSESFPHKHPELVYYFCARLGS
jgi:hypothetical protein